MNNKLKYLSFYQPYKIKGISKRNKIIFYLDIFENLLNKGIQSRTLSTWINNDITPILRPSSDLTKEIEINGDKFIPIDRLNEINGSICQWSWEFPLIEMPFSIVQHALSWHFNIYNLIDQGLAIDINTLK